MVGMGRARAAYAFTFALALTTAAEAQGPASPAAPAYRFEPLPKTAAELSKRFTREQIDLLEMINRRDREHLIRVDPPVPGLIVPAAWGDPLAYSPFPASWPAADAQPKAIVVHQPMQAFGAYEYGRLIRWGPVSTGRKETPTPDGAFNLTWRARSRRSTDNEDWLLEWYFNFVNARGVSFHLFDLPGYPASHACVRLLLRDAQWLYGWGDQWKVDATGRVVTAPGTPVVIQGTYAFGAPAPWLALDTLAVPLDLPASLALQGVAVAGPSSAARTGSLRSDSGR
jgi:lipoprotein-anchoring transpeptidase ErfK/SrfK